MKIGILTHYCNSTNYGGNLQAYALCKVLEEMGHQPEQLQIDHATCYQNLLNPQSRGLKRKLKNLAKPVARLLIPSYRKKWQGKEAERQRLAAAFARFNRQLRRSSMVGSRVIPRENGESAVIMTLNDDAGCLMTLELMAPDQRQAVRLGKLFEKKADVIYNLIMSELLEAEAELDG